MNADSTRLILALALAAVGMLLWQAWEKDYGVSAAPPPVQSRVAAGNAPESVPEPRATPDTGGQEAAAAPAPAAGSAASEARVDVETDVLQLQIGTHGAGLLRVALPKYPVSIERKDEPFVVMDASAPEYYMTQGGLLSHQPAPTDNSRYRSDQDKYVLASGEEHLSVPFHWEDGGISVTKTYELTRGSYLVDVRYEIHNGSGQVWQGRPYSQVQRTDPGRAGRRVVYTYIGAVLSSPEKRYRKIDFKEMGEQKLDADISNGWAAMLQHYFLTALIPGDPKATYHYYTMAPPRLPENHFVIGAIGPGIKVAPGETATTVNRVYVGPKLQNVLGRIADGLDLTVDYGKLWFIAKPLYWCLEQLRGLTGNWGWAIILVTVFLKLFFFPLSAAGYRSMANMRRVQPRIMAIRDRYKDDRARLNQAMMQIYKEEKINPFGGCFPIVIQIPVFVSLYWVLLESVELRQSGFISWLHDLSAPDPYWVLPIIMGATMLVQQRLNPAPMDPIQQKVMMIMPFAFTIFFGFFPSGLVLYWVVNNILSIAQQWFIMRKIVPASNRPPAKS